MLGGGMAKRSAAMPLRLVRADRYGMPAPVGGGLEHATPLTVDRLGHATLRASQGWGPVREVQGEGA